MTRKEPSDHIKVPVSEQEIPSTSSTPQSKRRRHSQRTLTAKFMGSGNATMNFTFQPKAKSPDFNFKVSIDEMNLPAMNDCPTDEKWKSRILTVAVKTFIDVAFDHPAQSFVNTKTNQHARRITPTAKILTRFAHRGRVMES